MVHPIGSRLFVPYYERPDPRGIGATPAVPGSNIGPWPLKIAAWNLDTGEITGTMTVPEVLVGSWQVEPIDQMYAGEYIMPAIALSPDGSRIAVVDTEMERLTLIDTATLTVADTLDIAKPEGFVSQALEWLGLAPQIAQAKISEGRLLSAAYSPDGRSLYLAGSETTVGDTLEDIEASGFGLLRIDISSGEIVAERLAGEDIVQIIPAPDGHSVYVLHPATPWWSGSNDTTTVLRRLDASSLEPLASTEFTTWVNLLIAPEGST
jgi:hypothetical protein